MITGVILSLYCIIPVHAQYSLGTTGLLTVPSAAMQADGRFMAGVNYLPGEMMPEKLNQNTGNYFVNITFLSFVEVAYRATILRNFRGSDNWQQDRSVALRLRPLKEGRYYPAIVVGSNDVFTTNELNPLAESSGNRYFSSVYAVGTKHFAVRGHIIGLTAGGYFLSRNSMYEGFFGGFTYSPAFARQLTLIGEYEKNSVNAGIAARLFNHVSIHLFTYDFKAVSGGMRYEFDLLR